MHHRQKFSFPTMVPLGATSHHHLQHTPTITHSTRHLCLPPTPRQTLRLERTPTRSARHTRHHIGPTRTTYLLGPPRSRRMVLRTIIRPLPMLPFLCPNHPCHPNFRIIPFISHPLHHPPALPDGPLRCSNQGMHMMPTRPPTYHA